jgi:redox-sensitive bicupin YhaK (pirin superfamily)
MDVRPHPHIHLATVTYLFAGAIHHRDSLGSSQWIEPGAVNWMTAGRGIVPSERTPEELRRSGSRLDGIQCWVALPAEAEEQAPSFVHHPAATLPEIAQNGVRLKVLLGEAFGARSPARVHSALFYLDAHFPAGAELDLPAELGEIGIYVAEGYAIAGGEELSRFDLGVALEGKGVRVKAREASRILFFGGEPLGERFMFWNFVSSKKESLEAAKAEWAEGPGSARFPKVPGDEGEFIPLPETTHPPGTIL